MSIMNHSVKANAEVVAGALNAEATISIDGKDITCTLNNFTILGEDVFELGSEEDNPLSTSTWDTDKLVSYSNWKKF